VTECFLICENDSSINVVNKLCTFVGHKYFLTLIYIPILVPTRDWQTEKVGIRIPDKTNGHSGQDQDKS
jgi:hypothetical protein